MDELNIVATELKAAEDQLQSLCASHGSTFVAVERRSAALTSTLKSLLRQLDSALPQVEESMHSLDIDSNKTEHSLSTLTEKHRLRRRTLLQHSSLLELLELPSLMDACVRGHLYEEGLSIASFANTLEQRHLTDADVKNSIVDNVVKEVRRREEDLRRDLLNRLRSDVTMPQCLEIVTALRRLNGVELDRQSRAGASSNFVSEDLEKLHETMEWKLQVSFLEARDAWLEADASMSSNAALLYSNKAKGSGGGSGALKSVAEKILDGIDLYRTRCFEIASQYLAIFRSSPSFSSKNVESSNRAYMLLSMWTTRRIDTFIQDHLSNRCLPQISDTATLRDALESATFFATSMGRLGADFSPMLQSIFQKRLIAIVTSHWADGLQVLENTLKLCRDSGVASPLYSHRDVSTLKEDAREGDTENVLDHHARVAPQPPRSLLVSPPLARLVNAFLVGLNELRRCLLACAFPELRRFSREEFISKAKQILVENERAVLTPGFLSAKGKDGAKLRSLAVELKDKFESCAKPYLEGSLEFALGSFENIAPNAFGPSQVSKEEKAVEENEAETISKDATLDSNDSGIVSVDETKKPIESHDPIVDAVVDAVSPNKDDGDVKPTVENPYSPEQHDLERTVDMNN